MHQLTNPEFIPQGKTWIIKADELYKVKQIRKFLETVEQELIEELKYISKYKNASGGEFRFMGIERKGTINYSLIPELQDIDLDHYRGEPVMMWKLEKECQ